jgi:putative phosphoribosyl transferase
MARSTPDELAHVEALERIELERRARRYRAGRTRTLLAERVVVNDGIATGSTANAACQVTRAADAEQVILAAPVAPHG